MKNLNNTQRATEFLYQRFPMAKKIAANRAEMKKVRLPGDEEETYLWAVKTGNATYGGVTINEDVYEFTAKDIIEWFPYNGEILSIKVQIIFLGKDTFLNILQVDNEDKAKEIIQQVPEFRTARGVMYFIESYQNLDGANGQKVLQKFWAQRLNVNGFAAVSPFSNEAIHIPNTDVRHLHVGDKVLWLTLRSKKDKLFLK